MELRTFAINYIDEYENHFKNANRNDVTFEKMEYAGYLLDKYFPDFTKNATCYKSLYEKCKKII